MTLERPSDYDLAAIAFVRARRNDDVEAQEALLADTDDAKALSVACAQLAWSALQLLTIKLGISPDEFLAGYHASLVEGLGQPDAPPTE